MIFTQPEQRAADQKTPDFVATIIEDVGIPVGMKALARILMLVEMGAIEKAETKPIGREMRRHPIQDHPNAMSMKFIDQIHQILGRSVIARRSKVSGCLVSPGTKKRVIHDGKKFHVGESHIFQVTR